MDIAKEFETKSKQIIEFLKQQIFAMRSNRPSPRLVEDIPVECYGQKMTVKQIGAISILPPTQIQISVWDKSVIGVVAKAIETSNLNVSANTEGNLIRINLPPLSDERRNELVKVVKREIEDAKIKMRAVRDEIMKKVNKDFEDSKITEDQKFKIKEEIQKLVDKNNDEIEKLLGQKIKELHE